MALTLKKKFPALGACLFLGWSLLSCGLDEIPYISPVLDPEWASRTVSGTAGIDLRLAEVGGTFQSFVIFYRVYLSNMLGGVPDAIGNDPTLRTSINPTLDADFRHFESLADHTDTAVNTAGLYNRFINRGFLKLELEDANIDNVLGSPGGTLAIDFLQEAGRRPRLILDGTSYYLRRAEHSDHFGHFSPLPRMAGTLLPFFNHPELRYSANRTNDINADVAPQIPAGSEYSYVMMYIVAVALDFSTPPTRVFSQPTYLGIFRLPNP